MGRYIKKFARVGQSLGPSEERGFAMWVGYDIEGVADDLSAHGLICVDGWSNEQLAAVDVVTFRRISARELGIEKKP